MNDNEKTVPEVELPNDFSEDAALAMLSRPDLPPEVCERMAKTAGLLKSRKVKVALVCHPRTPRHISVPVARQLYTFDLMKVALAPTVASDIKVAVEDILISRLLSLTIGERLTLARRASGRVAAALLFNGNVETSTLPVDRDRDATDVEDGEKKITLQSNAPKTRVMQTALENSRLTEALVIKSVLRSQVSPVLLDAVASHPKWSKQRELRLALLRTEYLSLAKAIEFSAEIPKAALIELMGSSRMPDRVKQQLIKNIEGRDSGERAEIDEANQRNTGS